MLAQAVGVIGAIGEDGGGPTPLQQSRNGEDVVALPRCDQEADGAAEGVSGHVDLGGQSSSGTPHSRVAPPFF